MELEGWPAILAFVGAAALVGVVLWLGATGRIGNGKAPMTPIDDAFEHDRNQPY